MQHIKEPTFTPFMFILSNIYGCLAQASQRSVTLDYGTFTSTIGSNQVFYNIPYAEPPVGQLRFKAPVEPKKREQRYSSSFGYSCMQKAGSLGSPNLATSEDCLNLNVFLPKNASQSDSLPVIVYVFGGGFDTGYAANPLYNANHIVSRENVVVVTFNYRVGPFGFMVGQGNDLNVGLLDQKMVFEWVRKYIKLFGGDPNQVTAMGQSAGAMSISYLMLKNKLFDRAILFSGAPLMIMKNATSGNNANILAERLNVSVSDLSTVSAESLLKASVDLIFQPVLDEQLIPKQPFELLDSAVKIPLLISNNRDEGSFFTFSKIKSPQIALGFEKMQYYFLDANEFGKLQSLYPMESYDTPWRKAADSFGDLVFNCPSIRFAKAFATYKMEFAHKPKIPLAPQLADIGVYHGSEIPIVWNIDSYLDDSEKEIASQLLNKVIRFASSGRLENPMYDSGKVAVVESKDFDYTKLDTDRDSKCQFWIDSINNYLSR